MDDAKPGEVDIEEAELRALAAAVAEALADPRPGIPHEEVETEAEAEIAELERLIAALPPTA